MSVKGSTEVLLAENMAGWSAKVLQTAAQTDNAPYNEDEQGAIQMGDGHL